LEPETRGMMALRGVDTLTAVTTMAELGDITRFDAPRQLMAFVGLVPSEHSSSKHRQRGGITKAGNAHVRRVLAEAAWCYRFPARKTAALQRRAERHQAYKPSPGKRRNGCVDGIVISRRVGCRRTKLVRPSHGSCWVSSGP